MINTKRYIELSDRLERQIEVHNRLGSDLFFCRSNIGKAEDDREIDKNKKKESDILRSMEFSISDMRTTIRKRKEILESFKKKEEKDGI